MRPRALRQAVLTLAALFAALSPAHAGEITYAELVRAGAEGARSKGLASEERLRLTLHGGMSPTAQDQLLANVPSERRTQPGGASAPEGATAGGVSLPQTGVQVETVSIGDVTGTVCDCGEIPPVVIPKVVGAFPWWPLAGIPLICVTGVCFDNEDNPPVTPQPTPPGPTPTPPQPEPIPEPATLLLFGTGLIAAAAGARRRNRARASARCAGPGEV